MLTDFHIMLPWLIILSATLVCFDKDWRPTGVVILLSQLLYSSFREEIEAASALNIGEFNALYDFSTAVILLLIVPICNFTFFVIRSLGFYTRLKGFQLSLNAGFISANMGIILCIFVGFHSALGLSILYETKTVFWTQYVNFILVLNLLQLYYFSGGVKDVIHQFYTKYSNRDSIVLGDFRSIRSSFNVGVPKKKSSSLSSEPSNKKSYS